MRIGLIDTDSHNYPNLAQMKISGYYKGRGDTVKPYNPWDERYDIVYISKVFSFSQEMIDCINADEVVRGGTGFAIKLVDGREVYDKRKDTELPRLIEHAYPDYSLYPQYTQDKAFGFLTRGCPRGCSFCHVKPKEGGVSYKVADLGEFWDGQKNIVLNDPNILACKDWADLFDQLIASRAKVDFNQGLDARLLTEEKIEALNQLRHPEIHFAWDKYEDGEKILPKLEMYHRLGKFKPHSHNAVVYVLCNFDTTFEQDIERVETLRAMNYSPYVMIYDKQHCDKRYKALQRWVNNRFAFWKVATWKEYNDNVSQRPDPTRKTTKHK